MKSVCQMMGAYDCFRVHAVTVIALTFCFRFRKESRGESGAIQNKKYIFVA